MVMKFMFIQELEAVIETAVLEKKNYNNIQITCVMKMMILIALMLLISFQFQMSGKKILKKLKAVS